MALFEILKVPHNTKIYTFEDPTSKDSDLNVLLNCLYKLNWLNIIAALWLKYQACEQQITSLNPPGSFVHTY